VDLKTVHNWADKGQVPHFRTPGRHLRFRRLDVIEFLRKYGYPIPESLRSAKPRVLIVDEDPAVLAAVRRTLGRRFELLTFADPFDALVAIGTLMPDAVVIDVDMSALDGMRCVERLRTMESTSHIRTVVYSRAEPRRRSAIDAGAFDFVAKGEVTLLREALERATGLERS
jgi:PleD family two-component response regulator